MVSRREQTILRVDSVPIKVFNRINALVEIGEHRHVVEPFEVSCASSELTAQEVYMTFKCEDVVKTYEKLKDRGGFTWGHIQFDSEFDETITESDILKGLLYFVSMP